MFPILSSFFHQGFGRLALHRQYTGKLFEIFFVKRPDRKAVRVFDNRDLCPFLNAQFSPDSRRYHDLTLYRYYGCLHGVTPFISNIHIF